MAVSMGEASGKLTLNAKPFFDSIKSATAGLKDFNKKTEETNAKLKKTETQTEKTGTKFDGFKDKVSKTTDKIKSASDSLQKLGGNLKGIGQSLGDTGKKMTTHITLPVAAAGAALVKSAVSSYSRAEQLIGGVDTLFKKSSKIVQKNADEAYKTTGMSANKYMETITSFSASLIKSLGGDTKKAAKVGDMALKDMADNANKFGTDIGSIQYAYQGFAKQNYTMLDNLKLGYGGTATEMGKLLLEHGKLTKRQKEDLKAAMKSGKNITQELGKIGFAKQIEAIHNVQKELDVTGTTSKEAAKTIEGSTNSMKSAWENLTSAMATGDYDQELENFKATLKTFLDNIKPVIQTTLRSIADELPGMLAPIMSTALSPFPKLQEKFDKLDEDEQGAIATSTLLAAVFAGPVLSALSSIVTILGSTITLIGKIPWSTLFSNLSTLATKLQNLPGLISKLPGVASGAASGLGSAFSGIGAALTAPVTASLGTVGAVIAAAIAGWEIGTWIREAIGQENIDKALYPIFDFFVDLWDNIVNFFTESIPEAFDKVVQFFEGIGDKIYEAVSPFIETIKGIGQWIWDNVLSPIVTAVSLVFQKIREIISKIWEIIKTVFSIVANWVYKHVIKPIVTKIIWFKDKIVGIFRTVVKFIKKVFGGLKGWFSELWENIKEVFAPVAEFFEKIFRKAIKVIKKVFGGIKKFFSDVWKEIKKIFKKAANVISDTFSGAFKAAFNGVMILVEGIVNTFVKAINGVVKIINKALPKSKEISKLTKLSLPRLSVGLDYVPYDGYQAILHKGERVMTKQENAAYSKGNNASGGNTFNFYSPKAISEAEAARQFKKVQRDLALGF